MQYQHGCKCCSLDIFFYEEDFIEQPIKHQTTTIYILYTTHHPIEYKHWDTVNIKANYNEVLKNKWKHCTFVQQARYIIGWEPNNMADVHLIIAANL